MLEKWGITRDNIDEAELNNSQSAERLADGQIDAYFYAAGWPVSAMVQLATTKGMELHSFTDEDLAIINETIPAYIPVHNTGECLRRCGLRCQDACRIGALGSCPLI